MRTDVCYLSLTYREILLIRKALLRLADPQCTLSGAEEKLFAQQLEQLISSADEVLCQVDEACLAAIGRTEN